MLFDHRFNRHSPFADGRGGGPAQGCPPGLIADELFKGFAELGNAPGFNQQTEMMVLNQFRDSADAAADAGATAIHGFLQGHSQRFFKRRLDVNGGAGHQFHDIVPLAQQRNPAAQAAGGGNLSNLFHRTVAAVKSRERQLPFRMAVRNGRKCFREHDLPFATIGDVPDIQDEGFAFPGRDGRRVAMQARVIDLHKTVAERPVPAAEVLQIVPGDGDFPADMAELVHFPPPTQWQQQRLEPGRFQIATVTG